MGIKTVIIKIFFFLTRWFSSRTWGDVLLFGLLQTLAGFSCVPSLKQHPLASSDVVFLSRGEMGLGWGWGHTNLFVSIVFFGWHMARPVRRCKMQIQGSLTLKWSSDSDRSPFEEHTSQYSREKQQGRPTMLCGSLILCLSPLSVCTTHLFLTVQWHSSYKRPALLYARGPHLQAYPASCLPQREASQCRNPPAITSS